MFASRRASRFCGLSLAAAAIAADQHNVGPDFLHPANTLILNTQAEAYAETIKNGGTPYLMSTKRMSAIIGRYLQNPTATIADVSVQLNIERLQVGEVRNSLRKRVASSLSENSIRELVGCALQSADADDYRKRSSRIPGHRLANPQAWSAWKAMEKKFNDEFPDSGAKFLDMVKKRDPSLLRFIPVENAYSGVLYAHLFKTDPRYCKSIEDARTDLISVCSAVDPTPVVEPPAEPNP